MRQYTDSADAIKAYAEEMGMTKEAIKKQL